MLKEETLEYVTRLICDDRSRIGDGVAVERDGEKAIIGWRRAAGEAGDIDMIEMLASFDHEDLVDAWNFLIDKLVPEGEQNCE